jgi:hypothetical protein
MKDKVYKFLKTYGFLLICTLLLDYENNKLTYPVGLTSGDEAAFAGAVRYNKEASSTNNSSFFMYTGVIIPVISLKGEVQVSGGTGLYNDPYIVLVVQ